MPPKKQKVLASKRTKLKQAETTVTFLDPVVMRDNEQEVKYNSLLKRKLITTRFACEQTLRTLGLLDDVYDLLQKIDIWHFATRTEKTYKQPTLEFLSSLKVDKNAKKMMYRLCGEEFQISDTELNKFLQFPTEGEEKAPHDENFRMLLTDEKGATSTTKLQHPAFRYIQRFLAGSILGRGGTASTVADAEFFFLKCMLTHTEPRQPNLGWFMMKNLQQVASNAHTRGIISIGGLVTIIAKGHGLSFEYLNALDDQPFLNIKTLHYFRLIQVKEPQTPEDIERIYHIGHDGVRTLMPLRIPPIDPADPTTWMPRTTTTQDAGQSSRSQDFNLNDMYSTVHEIWGDMWVMREDQQQIREQVNEIRQDFQGMQSGLERLEATNNEMRSDMHSIKNLVGRLCGHFNLPPPHN
jgi:ATHILA ORF-1 family